MTKAFFLTFTHLMMNEEKKNSNSCSFIISFLFCFLDSCLWIYEQHWQFNIHHMAIQDFLDFFLNPIDKNSYFLNRAQFFWYKEKNTFSHTHTNNVKIVFVVGQHCVWENKNFLFWIDPSFLQKDKDDIPSWHSFSFILHMIYWIEIQNFF